MSQNILWTIILGAGAIQGLFLGSVLLFGHNGNRRLGLLVATLLVIFGIGILAQVLQDELAPSLGLLIAFLNINTELTIGPVYYLIIRSLVLPQRDMRSVEFLHLLPFLLGLAIWGSAWVGVDDHQRLVRFGFDTEFPVLKFMVFKAVILYSYFFVSCRLLVRASQNALQLYAGRHRVDPSVLLRISVAVACVPAVIYGTAAIDHLGYASDLDSDQVGGLLLVGTIFSVAWLLLFRPWVLSLKAGDSESRRWRHEARTLATYLDQEKPWLNPDLRSADVASNLHWTESTLASVTKHGMRTTFQGLVNDCRLREFERLARNCDSRSRDVLRLAFDAGFGSKATFYRAFRQAHDTTPTQYCDSIVQALSSKASQLSK